MKRHYLVAVGILAAAAALLGLLTTPVYAAPGSSFAQVHRLQEIARERAFTDGEMDQLVAFVSNKDWEVRVRALTALRHVAAPEQKAKAVRAMRDALRDEAAVVRVYAVSGLGRIGDTSEISALKPLLKDPQPVVRSTAYRTIGSLYLAAGDTGKAITAYEGAARVPGLYPEFLVRAARDLVNGYHAAGRPEQAVSFIQSLLAGEPENRSYQEMLAIAYEAAGQPDKAAEWRRRSRLEGNPAPAIALKSLAGEEQTLGAYRGKIVLLNFFASW
jgi:tetratricopeptide (TPR) repeat protein